MTDDDDLTVGVCRKAAPKGYAVRSQTGLGSKKRFGDLAHGKVPADGISELRGGEAKPAAPQAVHRALAHRLHGGVPVC